MQARSPASSYDQARTEFEKLSLELQTIAYAAGLRHDETAKPSIDIAANLAPIFDLMRDAREGKVNEVGALLNSLLQNNPLHQLYQQILIVNHSANQLREAPAMLQRISSAWNQYLLQSALSGYRNSRFNASDASWWELCEQTKNNELAVLLVEEFLSRANMSEPNIFSRLVTGLFGKQADNTQPAHPDLEAPHAYRNYEALQQNYLTTLLYDSKYAPFLGKTYQEGWITCMRLVNDLEEFETNFNGLLQMSMEKGDYRSVVNDLHVWRRDYNHYLDLYRGLVLAYCRKQYQEDNLQPLKQALSRHHVVETMRHLNQLWAGHVQHMLFLNMVSMLNNKLNPEAAKVWQPLVAKIKASQPDGCDDKWHGASDVTHMLASASDPQLLATLITGYILPSLNLRKHNIGLFAQPVKQPDGEPKPELQRRNSI